MELRVGIVDYDLCYVQSTVHGLVIINTRQLVFRRFVVNDASLRRPVYGDRSKQVEPRESLAKNDPSFIHNLDSSITSRILRRTL